MRQRFQAEQWLPFPREVVFAFFANPINLPPLMPAWQCARIDEVTLVPPPARAQGAGAVPGIAAGTGTTLLISARAAPGIPLRLPWLAFIEDFRWNDQFCDVQLKGPFAYWRHCHSVHEETRFGESGTLVRDQVIYELPLAPWSRLLAPAASVGMRALFGFRQRRAGVLIPQFANRMQRSAESQETLPRR